MNTAANESGCFVPENNQTGSLVEEYLCYLDEKKNRSALTLDSYRNDFDQFTAFLTDAGTGDVNTRILSVDTDGARKFVDYLKAQYTASTLSRKITAVRGLYGYLVSEKRLSANPFADIQLRPAEPQDHPLRRRAAGP